MSDSVVQIELKPCPFCGGRGEVKSRDVKHYDDDGEWDRTETRYVVRCTTCNCTTRLSFSEKDASEMWNRRANGKD